MALQEINKLEDIWDRNIENSNKVGSYMDIILESMLNRIEAKGDECESDESHIETLNTFT